MPIDINKNNKLIFFLMGPTGSGKSDFAVSLAKKLPLEIVNIDSALVYKEMDIGTAKPTKQMQQQDTHHLIDILNPTANYSAEQCLKLCKKKK